MQEIKLTSHPSYLAIPTPRPPGHSSFARRTPPGAMLKEIEGGSPKRAGEVGLPETLRRAPHPTRPRNGPQSDELRAKGVGMGVIRSAALT